MDITPFTTTVKRAVGDRLPISTVGRIENANFANQLREEGLDIVRVGWGLKNPGLVWSFAEELNCEISMSNQIRWGFVGRCGSGFFKTIYADNHDANSGHEIKSVPRLRN